MPSAIPKKKHLYPIKGPVEHPDHTSESAAEADEREILGQSMPAPATGADAQKLPGQTTKPPGTEEPTKRRKSAA